MFVLHVDLQVKEGFEGNLESTYLKTFRPAVTRQEGFSAAALLRPVEGKGNYLLSLEFEAQALQQKWVASDLHQQVWPQMEANCAAYSVRAYNTV